MVSEKCTQCGSTNIYHDGLIWTCPECSYEWTDSDSSNNNSEDLIIDTQVKDAHGTLLNTGDSIIVIKELNIKGASGSVKIGTKVKNIRIIDGDDGHNIACKIDGIGAINLKSEFVRKS